MKSIVLFSIFLLNAIQLNSQQLNTVDLVSYNQSQCDESSDPRRLKSRVINKTINKDTLHLEIAFAAQCCVEYTPQLKFDGDTLFLALVEETQGGCSCYCCYSYILSIKGIKNMNFIAKFYDIILEQSNEKYKTYPVAYTILKGDTVNVKDKYGLKQGFWKEGKYSFITYNDDLIQTSGHLYKNGKKKDEYVYQTKKKKEYGRFSQLKKEYTKQ